MIVFVVFPCAFVSTRNHVALGTSKTVKKMNAKKEVDISKSISMLNTKDYNNNQWQKNKNQDDDDDD